MYSQISLYPSPFFLFKVSRISFKVVPVTCTWSYKSNVIRFLKIPNFQFRIQLFFHGSNIAFTLYKYQEIRTECFCLVRMIYWREMGYASDTLKHFEGSQPFSSPKSKKNNKNYGGKKIEKLNTLCSCYQDTIIYLKEKKINYSLSHNLFFL